VHWLWGFLCHLRQRGAVTHPEMVNFAADGNLYAFTRTAGRKEWLPGLGEHTPHPVFLTLGNDRGYDQLVNARAATFYQTWLRASLGANGLLPRGSDDEIYGCAIDELVRQGILSRMSTDRADVLGLNADALVLETEVSKLVSSEGKRALVVPTNSAEALIGMPCLDATQECYSKTIDAGGWLARRFSRGDLRRVFSAEHTGLLQRDQRETLELRFKAKITHPWYENLLSATPTLEMGVDIGDLSSVMLCSVPPNQASYLQRTGRAGRRDGNAFTTTLADGSSPHDLYFFEDTDEMLQGEVVPPGIFLKAAEVLRRQMFAFCLDEWVGSGIAETALPDKTKDALDARDSLDRTRFPATFLDYVLAHDERLLVSFQNLLGADLDERVSKRLQSFMQGTEEDDALRIALSKVLEALAKERQAHKDRGEQIRKQIKVAKGLPQDEATRNEVDRLERERQKTMELVKEINERELLNTLTDAGLIPNYAFPEAGVELKSLLWRKKGTDDPEGSGTYISLPAERYERPAQSALSEFAPENVFYANQRKVEIDQINVGLSEMQRWRLCRTCQHMENLEIHADSHGTCPRCADPMWANISQERRLLRFRQAIANSNDIEVRIDDSAEDREPKFYVRQLLADFDVKDIKEAYRLRATDMPFGFEFVERVVFRDINFGEPTKPGEIYSVAGEKKQRPPSWLGTRRLEALYWNQLALAMDGLLDHLEEASWWEPAAVIEQHVLAVYGANRAILRRGPDGSIDALLRPRITASLAIHQGQAFQLKTWLNKNVSHEWAAEAQHLLTEVERIASGTDLPVNPSDAAVEQRSIAALIDKEHLPESTKNIILQVIRNSISIHADNLTRAEIDIIEDAVKNAEHHPDYQTNPHAHRLFDSVLMWLVRFLFNRLEMTRADDPTVEYLFQPADGKNVKEDALQADFFRWLTTNAAGSDLEPTNLGGGRADVRLRSSSERVVIEVKRELEDSSFDALAASYQAQTTDYQNVSVRLGFLLVLDLTNNSNEGTPHIRSLVQSRSVQRTGEDHSRLLVIVKVPGNRKRPSELTKAAKTSKRR
jgi:Helicase conserved C-terminal domain